MQPDPCPAARYPGSVFRVRWGTRAESICSVPGRKRRQSCCSQELFLAAMTEREVSPTPLFAAASPAWDKESASLASHTSYKA